MFTRWKVDKELPSNLKSVLAWLDSKILCRIEVNQIENWNHYQGSGSRNNGKREERKSLPPMLAKSENGSAGPIESESSAKSKKSSASSSSNESESEHNEYRVVDKDDQYFSKGKNVNSYEQPLCTFCKKEKHSLFRCESFTKQTWDKKYVYITYHKLCYNCLSPKHETENCESRFHCKKCKGNHHTLLCRSERA